MWWSADPYLLFVLWDDEWDAADADGLLVCVTKSSQEKGLVLGC